MILEFTFHRNVTYLILVGLAKSHDFDSRKGEGRAGLEQKVTTNCGIFPIVAYYMHIASNASSYVLPCY